MQITTISQEEARYVRSPIQDYRGNPFIECLPDIRTEDELIEFLTYRPTVEPAERQMDAAHRIHLVERLGSLRVPTDQMIRLCQRVDIALRHGYVGRNPSINEARASMYTGVYPRRVDHRADPHNILLLGLSGTGKTTALRGALSQYPQVITHSGITPGIAKETQLVWLVANCPHDASLSGLCLAICEAIDKALGTDYACQWQNLRGTIECRLQSITRILNNLHLGVLVLDELQHLSAAKAGGARKMLDFFVNLINGIRLPIVLAGTFTLERVLSAQVPNARRATGSGSIIIPRLMKGDLMWDRLMKDMEACQCVQKPEAINDEVSLALHDCSVGIRDTAIKLFQAAQAAAINLKTESIDAELIRNMYHSHFRALHPAYRQLRQGTKKDEDPIFDDLESPMSPTSWAHPATSTSSTSTSNEAKSPSTATNKKQFTRVIDRDALIPLSEDARTRTLADIRDAPSQDTYDHLKVVGLVDHDLQWFHGGR